MPFDPMIKHPDYLAFQSSWELMRDAVAGEDDVKAKGVKYLPMKTGTAAIPDAAAQRRVYDLYKMRAEFPEIVAPTIRGSVGVMLKKSAEIQLPEVMEPLRERATLDGLTLDALHRRMGMEVMTTGRYGLLPSLAPDGTPYLAGYNAESIINWDATDGLTDFVMLDESGPKRNRDTGEWGTVNRLRECTSYDGAYVARVWVQDSEGAWHVESEEAAANPRGQGIAELPFVFIGSLDLTAAPDDVPLYGLGKLAVRVYRLDADYSFALHMTSEPTPVAIGFDDPAQAIENGHAPKTLGSSVLWILPAGGDAKYLEFSGPGIQKQEDAIKNALDRAAHFGAQVLQQSNSAESGDALRMRASSQTATLTTIAQTTASGLERALRNIAVWIGADPEQVVVTPNLDFFDANLTAQDIQAIVAAWQAGAISYSSMFDRLKRGGVIHADTDEDEEQDAIANEGVDEPDPEIAAILANSGAGSAAQPGAEGAV